MTFNEWCSSGVARNTNHHVLKFFPRYDTRTLNTTLLCQNPAKKIHRSKIINVVQFLTMPHHSARETSLHPKSSNLLLHLPNKRLKHRPSRLPRQVLIQHRHRQNLKHQVLDHLLFFHITSILLQIILLPNLNS